MGVRKVSDFDKAFAIIIGHEGGYVNDPDDPGGETKYGISKRYHPDEDIKGMTLERAKQIYKAGYWDRVSGDRLPWPWDLLLFDTVVNQGGGPAHWVSRAQEAVGTKADGIIGPNTIGAMARLSGNAAKEAVALYMADRLLRYVEKSKPRFHRGLFKRVLLTAMEATSGIA